MSEPLFDLQHLLKRHSLDAFLVPTQDRFMSEYPPESAQRLRFLTGFTGSAGTGVVFANPLKTGHSALLFTDGRYLLQASQQLDASRFLVIDSADESPASWLNEHLPGAIVGFDPWLHTMIQLKLMMYGQISRISQQMQCMIIRSPMLGARARKKLLR